MNVQSAVRYATYPLLVLGGAVGLIAGLSIGAPYVILAPSILVTAAVTVAALERSHPYAKEWQHDLGDSRVDLLHLLGNVAVSQLSLLLFASGRAATPGLGLWPHEWPTWGEALLALVIVDLGLYIVHRVSHGVGWLWRLHAIHHSARRVYWVNGQRRHLLHELLEGAPGLAVLFVLGAPTGAYATAIAIVTLHLLLQHANIDYRLGPLRRLFSTAELHRWHHQRRWQDVQGNYAAVFSLWDLLFRSSLRWRGHAPPDVGMDDEPDLPTTYRGQLLWPFVRRR